MMLGMNIKKMEHNLLVKNTFYLSLKEYVFSYSIWHTNEMQATNKICRYILIRKCQLYTVSNHLKFQCKLGNRKTVRPSESLSRTLPILIQDFQSRSFDYQFTEQWFLSFLIALNIRGESRPLSECAILLSVRLEKTYCAEYMACAEALI